MTGEEGTYRALTAIASRGKQLFKLFSFTSVQGRIGQVSVPVKPITPWWCTTVSDSKSCEVLQVCLYQAKESYTSYIKPSWYNNDHSFMSY